MIKVIKSIDKWIIINTEIREQKFTKDYKFFYEYKKYGFDTIEDFIKAFVYKEIDKGMMRTLKDRAIEEDAEKEKEENLKRKKEGYKKKLRKERKEKLIKQYKQKYPDKKHYEIMEMAIAKVDNKVNWKFYINLTYKEKKSLKRKMRLKKKDIKAFIEDISLEENEFETIKQVYDYISGEVNFRDYFNITYITGDCPLIEGYKSVINKFDDFYKIMSFNPKKQEGIIFNIWDLLDSYNIDIFNFIKMKKLKVDEVEEYNRRKKEYNKKLKQLDKEKKRYRKLLDKIEKRTLQNRYPILFNYLKPHMEELKFLLKLGIDNIKTVKQLDKDNNVVFFASRRYLVNIYQKKISSGAMSTK
ncbi:hypothetical protein, partial [Dethiothermospora halolimnae]|uniref:hypothetical protein n=1 Tax=Dethiothermospora halolimnae TaxID=3114390 RepID=UPI003CCBDA51